MLPAPVYASALVDGHGNIPFSRTDNTGTGIAKEDDKVLMVAWFPESKEVVYKIGEAGRKDCTALLQMNLKKALQQHGWVL